MPTIIPIRDLKKTSEISRMLMLEVYSKLEVAEEQVKKGEVLDAVAGLKSIRANTCLFV